MSENPITRLDLLDWLLPCCEPTAAALSYPQQDKAGIGWVYGETDAFRAITAFREGTLREQSFDSVNQQGVPYTIRNPSQLGLVPHRVGMVGIFCIDLDDHHGDGGNLRLLGPVARFLGAEPVVFTSRSGKGFHALYRLATPVPVEDFRHWSKGWSFNRDGRPEAFPKSTGMTQFWLPNESNERGGDAYVSGSFQSCVVGLLPEPPSRDLTTTTLTFLMGESDPGNRNNGLNKAAFELGRKGLERVEAWALCERGARLAGLKPDETATTFGSGYGSGRTAGPPTAQRPSTDTAKPLTGFGNGERFATVWGLEARYCFQIARWLTWDGRRWSSREDGRVQRMAKDAIRAIELERADAMAQAEEDARDLTGREYRFHIKRSSSSHGVAEALDLASSEPGMALGLDDLDRDPMLFNVGNGTIDLRTGSLRSHRREDNITTVSAVEYQEDAVCPRWEKFLLEIFAGDEEMVGFVQRAVGYALTGLTSEQCMIFLYGDGQNGKSTVINTLTALFGGYAQKAPTDLIMRPERSGGGGPSPDMARLRGMRFVTTSELEEGVRLGEARIKDLTGGDRIVARPLYKDPIEFDPTHTLFVYGNHKPRIEGTDEGIWRRIHLIHLPVRIPDAQKDKGLGQALREELSGILNWAIRGCLDWQRDGLGVPTTVREATSAYRSESDPVSRFVEECCELGPVHSVSKKDLYQRYMRWCEEDPKPVLTSKGLSMRLVAMGIKDDRVSQERYWLGIMPQWEGGQ